MDPNVQVALVSVIATLITTGGVVAVAMINNRKERGNAASAGVDAGVNAGLDDRDILERWLALIDENRRKEETIQALKKQVFLLIQDNESLRERLVQEGDNP